MYVGKVIYYPARFPLSILDRVWRKIETTKNPIENVIDPFMGSGISCIYSIKNSCDFIGYDLNPLSCFFVSTLFVRLDESHTQKIEALVDDMFSSNDEFEPDWPNINYWYDEAILNVLKKAWGFIHSNVRIGCDCAIDPTNPDDAVWLLLAFVLLKVSRKYSYADDSVAKLYRSRFKERALNAILKKADENIEKLIRKDVESIARRAFKLAIDNTEASTNIYIEGGVDVVSDKLTLNEADLLLTSPPYMIAHEYTRSTKLELYWLGYPHTFIKWMRKHEIPYNTCMDKVNDITIYSKCYQKYKKLVMKRNPRLLCYYVRYFKSIAKVFEKLEIRQYAAIFVGEATLAGMRIPIPKILEEHLSSLGFKKVYLIRDPIRARKLFKGRKNPNPTGIKEEHLLLLKVVD